MILSKFFNNKPRKGGNARQLSIVNKLATIKWNNGQSAKRKINENMSKKCNTGMILSRYANAIRKGLHTRTSRSPTPAYFARTGSRGINGDGLIFDDRYCRWNVLTIDFEFLKGLSWPLSRYLARDALQRCLARKEMDSANGRSNTRRTQPSPELNYCEAKPASNLEILIYHGSTLLSSSDRFENFHRAKIL